MKRFPAALCILLSALTLGSCSDQRAITSEKQPEVVVEKPATPPVPNHFETVREAQPYPEILPAAAFPDQRVAKVYAMAKEIPAVLSQQPCYCFCDRAHGHRSLLDCFHTDHGAHCGVCLKEAAYASRMTKAGKTAEQIREAIIRGEWRQIEL